MRGNVEEGRETHAHGTFINGFHETWPIRHAEEAFGFARVGQTIVNVPDNKIDQALRRRRAAAARGRRLSSTTTARSTSATACCAATSSGCTPAGKRVQVQLRPDGVVHPAAPGDHDLRGHGRGRRRAVVHLQPDAEPPGRADEYHVRSAAMEGTADFDPRKAERLRGAGAAAADHWARATGAARLPLRPLRHDPRGRGGPPDRDRERLHRAPSRPDTGKIVYQVPRRGRRAR